MENKKIELLECTNSKTITFLGNQKIILECPYCSKEVSKSHIKMNALENFLDLKVFLCECQFCENEYYYYD